MFTPAEVGSKVNLVQRTSSDCYWSWFSQAESSDRPVFEMMTGRGLPIQVSDAGGKIACIRELGVCSENETHLKPGLFSQLIPFFRAAPKNESETRRHKGDENNRAGSIAG